MECWPPGVTLPGKGQVEREERLPAMPLVQRVEAPSSDRNAWERQALAHFQRRLGRCGRSWVKARRSEGPRLERACFRVDCRVRCCEQCSARRGNYFRDRIAVGEGSDRPSAHYELMVTLGVPSGAISKREAWQDIGSWAGRFGRKFLEYWNILQGRPARERGDSAAYAWVIEKHRSGWPHVHIAFAIPWRRLPKSQFRAMVQWMRLHWANEAGLIEALPRRKSKEVEGYCEYYPYVKEMVGVCRVRVSTRKGRQEGADKYLTKYITKDALTLDQCVMMYRRRIIGTSWRAPVRQRSGWDVEGWMSRGELDEWVKLSKEQGFGPKIDGVTAVIWESVMAGYWDEELQWVPAEIWWDPASLDELRGVAGGNPRNQISRPREIQAEHQEQPPVPYLRLGPQAVRYA